MGVVKSYKNLQLLSKVLLVKKKLEMPMFLRNILQKHQVFLMTFTMTKAQKALAGLKIFKNY